MRLRNMSEFLSEVGGTLRETLTAALDLCSKSVGKKREVTCVCQEGAAVPAATGTAASSGCSRWR